MNQFRAIRFTKLPAFVVGTFLLLLFTSSALAQAKQDFTLHNNTGKTIEEVYVSPYNINDWEEDVMGPDDTLENRTSVDISFSRSEKADYWDIKVVFADGKTAVWGKLNLSQITDVTISFKNGKPWATWKNGG